MCQGDMGKILSVLRAVPVLFACWNDSSVACFKFDLLALIDHVALATQAEQNLVAGVDVEVILGAVVKGYLAPWPWKSGTRKEFRTPSASATMTG